MVTSPDIVRVARGWIGTPYRHQASLRGAGTDCLGLIRGVWREVYGAEPETTPAYTPGWAEAGGSEALASAARRHMIEISVGERRAGDMLLFRWRSHLPAKHAGIATGCNHMVHAQDGAMVAEIALNDWWRRHLSHAFRFPGIEI